MSIRVEREDFIVPRCTAACPAGVDVPRYIRAIRDGRYDNAVAVLREKLPLPTGVCGCVLCTLRRRVRVQAVWRPPFPSGLSSGRPWTTAATNGYKTRNVPSPLARASASWEPVRPVSLPHITLPRWDTP